MFALPLIAAMLAAGQTPAAAGPRTVRPDPAAVEVARWEGWGTSLSWWAVATAGWPDAARTELCRRLFSRDAGCLGLTIARYNAGGTEPSADPKPFRIGGRVLPCLERDGSFDAARDRAQIECLKLSKRFGADTFELFANSPPYWMLKNGNSRGGDKAAENLKPEEAGAFAKWLMETARRTEREAGVRFASVEPFNEPSAWWWDGAKGGQEGCKIERPLQAKVIRALHAEIAREGRRRLLAASDENGSADGHATLDYLLRPPSARPPGDGLDPRWIGRLNVHAYNNWDWQKRLRDLARKSGIKRLWMSEVSHREWENLGFAPDDMRCALPDTRSIVSDIKNLRCDAWVYWQPVEPLQYCLWWHFTYGVFAAAFDADVEYKGRTLKPGEFVATKKLAAIRQFTAHILPGDKLVASGDDWTLAAVSRDRRRLTLVVHNDAKEPRPYAFDLAGFRTVGAPVQAWRTRDDGPDGAWDERPLPAFAVSGGRFEDVIPPLSVTTYEVALRP